MEQQEYRIPAPIEDYLEHDDYNLKKVLRNSKNPWAQKVVSNTIPTKIFESFGQSQLDVLNDLEEFLRESSVEYIKCSSVGRLSKYYESDHEHTRFPMKVIRNLHGTDKYQFFNINDATDLFSKFSQTHAVNRIHCEIESLPDSQRNSIYSIISSQV